MNAITERSWTGAVLRSVAFDLNTRTLILELYAGNERCERIVVTNADVALDGQLDGDGGPPHCLVDEPVWVPSTGDEPDTVTFTTDTFAITVSGGMVSIDGWVEPDVLLPLWADTDGLADAAWSAGVAWGASAGDWRRAA